MANYMSEVAKMLGVELGERFKIDFDIYNSSNRNFEYYLSNEGIVLDKEGYSCCSNDILCELIRGNYTIKRKPWKPQYDELYFYVNANGYVTNKRWKDGWIDMSEAMQQIYNYKLGNCYRTKEEAEANVDKWKAFYASDEILEV